MAALPTGTLTFLFTDIEGSTRMLHALGEAFGTMLERHQELVRDAIGRNGGIKIHTEGDAFFCVFVTARQALEAAVEIQRAMASEVWPQDHTIRLRIGVHTGVAAVRGDDYVGLDVHRASRISETGHGGQVVVSESTRVLGESELPEGVTIAELGEFRLRDLDRPERLYQLEIDGLDRVFPPLRKLDSRPSRLPAEPSSFVGRDRERQEVEKLLQDSRLVTITGVAGAGKSRLAMAVASGAGETYPDGIWLVELAAATNDDLVPHTVAHAMGLQESASRSPTDTLVDYFGDNRCLLVLDNCEHVVGGVGIFARTVTGANPGLRILATSRQVLGVSGEARYPCPPLSTPPEGADSLSTILAFDSVALFEARARGVDPSFRMGEDVAGTVAAICRRLDGMPLAIELAAALVRILTPQAILDRLGHRFDLLTGGPRSAPSHQQTLRAALASTFELLDGQRQEFAARLGVFSGSFDVTAAEAVASGGEVPQAGVIDALLALVDRSLVDSQQTGGELRLSILESVREYLLTELEARGQLDERRRAHAEHYESVVRTAAKAFRGPEQDAWSMRVDADIGNVRSAITYTAGIGDEAALRIANSTFLYWLMRGLWSSGLHWTRVALEGASQEDSALRARVLASAGFFASDLGQADVALADLEEALAMARRVDDPHAQGYCASFLGAELTRRAMDFSRGLALLEEAREVYSELNQPYGEAWVVRYLGTAHQKHGNFEEAIRLQRMSLETFRDAGDPWNIRRTQSLLGEALHTVGDLTAAREQYEEALRGPSDSRFRVVIAQALKGLGKVALAEGRHDDAAGHLSEAFEEFREIGDVPGMAATTGHMAIVELRRGDLSAAHAGLVKGLRAFREMNDQVGAAWCLEHIAGALSASGSFAKAVRLLGAADAIRERTGSSRPVVYQAGYDEAMARVRTQLGEDGANAEYQIGWDSDFDEAVSVGLEPLGG